MKIKELITSSAIRSGIPTQLALAKKIGMQAPTLCKKLKRPELITGYEMGVILKATRMTDEDRLEWLRQLERGKA